MKSKSEVFHHFTEKTNENKKKYMCNFCSVVYNFENATKFALHILKCKKAPEDVKQNFKHYDKNQFKTCETPPPVFSDRATSISSLQDVRPNAMGKNEQVSAAVGGTMPVLRNADHPASQATDSVATRYAVAVLGAWAAEIVTYPFDLTKTRIQIQSEVAAAKQGLKLENLGMFKTAEGIVRHEGVLKLWSGLMPMFQRHIIYSGSRLIFYEYFRGALRDENGQMSLGAASLGGLAAGSLAQLIASPTDLVKVQMQTEGRRVLHGCQPRFSGCLEAYRLLYKESGILGFWRGAIPNVQRAALVNMGDLAAYDYTKQLLIREFGMADTAAVHACAAFTAGFVAAVVGTPADVLKTRLMNQPVGVDGRGLLYRGMIDCFQQSVRNEGILALYKGFLPLWMRLGPWALINWIAFENIMLAVGGKTF